jgi:16S rRNA (uracil1498-N3)-methyltransferase
MSTPYLFIDPKQVYGKTIFIRDIDDVKHLSGPLRAKPGDEAYISDNSSFRYKAELTKINKIEAEFNILEKEHIYEKLPLITLFQCVLKKNAMEYSIQKATEIGLSSIIPVISERTVTSTGDKSQKIKRWQKISDEASKQSKRDFKCCIEKPVMLKDIDMRSFDRFFVPYEGASADGESSCNFNGISREGKIAYLIGPEGGFSSSEVELLSKNNAELLKLGDNILRAETAAVYFLSVIDFYIRANS